MRFLIGLIVLLPSLSFAQDVPTDQQIQDALNMTAETYLAPKSEVFSRRARTFADNVAAAHCGPEDAVNRPIEFDFIELVSAYVPISIWQAGPMNQQEGVLRFQLWPDGKGFAKRAVDRAIRDQNQSLLDWQNVRGQGVALINLTALEYLVADIELVEGEYACGLLISISENYAVMAAEFAAQWQEGSAYRVAFETAIEGNEIYPNVAALLREGLSGLRATTQHLRDKKLLRPLGEAQGEARAIRAEFRRLDLSMLSIVTHLTSLSELLQISGGIGELTDAAVGDENTRVLSQTTTDRSLNLALSVFSMQDVAREDEEVAQELRDLANFTNIYVRLFGTDMPEALGITAGFSSADGD